MHSSSVTRSLRAQQAEEGAPYLQEPRPCRAAPSRSAAGRAELLPPRGSRARARDSRLLPPYGGTRRGARRRDVERVAAAHPRAGRPRGRRPGRSTRSAAAAPGRRSRKQEQIRVATPAVAGGAGGRPPHADHRQFRAPTDTRTLQVTIPAAYFNSENLAIVSIVRRAKQPAVTRDSLACGAPRRTALQRGRGNLSVPNGRGAFCGGCLSAAGSLDPPRRRVSRPTRT
jgi:hypothetical protein